MSRPIRFLPDPKTLVEVSTRTLQSRLLLRPSLEINEAVVGILGRAQRLYHMEVCAVAFVSNHYHLLLRVESAKQLAGFMTYVNSNLAREVGRRVDWREKFWARRYRAIPVSGEEGAQRERLKYVLSQGVKEGLVERCRDWPGVHSVRALVEDEPIVGYWFDRTQEYAARRRDQDYDRLHFATPEILVLSPLPCWEHLPPELRRQHVVAIVQEIEREAEEERRKSGKTPPGASAVQERDPSERPLRSKKSPAPLFHTASRKVYRELCDSYFRFLRSFREAAERLRAGDRSAAFPEGCFPPALPFVGG